MRETILDKWSSLNRLDELLLDGLKPGRRICSFTKNICEKNNLAVIETVQVIWRKPIK